MYKAEAWALMWGWLLKAVFPDRCSQTGTRVLGGGGVIIDSHLLRSPIERDLERKHEKHFTFQGWQEMHQP